MQWTRLLLAISLLLFAVASQGFVAHRSSGPASPTTSRRNSRLLAAAPTHSDRPNALVTVVKHTLLSVLAFAQIAGARPEGVNRPDLLPKEANVPLIDVANFLSKGQEKKVVADLADLEKRTGYKLRVLCQSYPNTPGLAIKEYWGVDDNTVVLVRSLSSPRHPSSSPPHCFHCSVRWWTRARASTSRASRPTS
jgi:hypothetical protein